MSATIDEFVEDMRKAGLGGHATAIGDALHKVDIEADYNAHATALFEGISWVLNHKNKSVVERLAALNKLLQHDRGPITLPDFVGWE